MTGSQVTKVGVVGNVQAENREFVTLSGSNVGGSVRFDQGGAFNVANHEVAGSIRVVSNDGASRLKANTDDADIRVFGHDGGVAIVDNRIDGNPRCKENAPAPTGGGNRIRGNKEDQCRKL